VIRDHVKGRLNDQRLLVNAARAIRDAVKTERA